MSFGTCVWIVVNRGDVRSNCARYHSGLMRIVDWLWNTFVAPWPDWPVVRTWLPGWQVGTFEIRDALNLLMTSVGAWLAWKAIQMGQAQDQVTERQTAILAKLEELETGQARIAERQHEVFERELSRKAVLKVAVPRPKTPTPDERTVYQMFIANEGDKANWGYWYVGVPKRLGSRLELTPAPGHALVPVATDGFDVLNRFDSACVVCFSDDYYLIKCQALEHIAEGDMRPCGTIAVTWQGHEFIDARLRTLLWFTNGPSGRFPSTGMMKLKLYSSTESWFKSQYGGLPVPPDDEDHVGVSPGPVV